MEGQGKGRSRVLRCLEEEDIELIENNGKIQKIIEEITERINQTQIQHYLGYKGAKKK